MREIDVSLITGEVKRMCIEANYILGMDVINRLEESRSLEESDIGESILQDIIRNANVAKEDSIPMCQDTGMVVIFMEIGQDVHFVGGDINEAINQGIREGYQEGYLRKSVVEDPFFRVNTKDNTPGIIHMEIVPGDQVKIVLAPKGFGSENMSRSKMLKPSDGIEGFVDFVLETVSIAGPNPCPPIVVGIGVGGTLDKAAILAKKALTRDIASENPVEYLEELEKTLLKKINDLGIGPQGLGGRTTALSVHINRYPTHIAGLPVVVNINCHASRHKKIII